MCWFIFTFVQRDIMFSLKTSNDMILITEYLVVIQYNDSINDESVSGPFLVRLIQNLNLRIATMQLWQQHHNFVSALHLQLLPYFFIISTLKGCELKLVRVRWQLIPMLKINSPQSLNSQVKIHEYFFVYHFILSFIICRVYLVHWSLNYFQLLQ